MAEQASTLIIRNIKQLVTWQGGYPRVGGAMREPGLVENATIIISDGHILAIGSDKELASHMPQDPGTIEINAEGRVVTPGLIDPHTHPVFSTTREDEFEKRLQGVPYMEIAQAGGGIRRSVRDLRTTTKERLKEKTRRRLDRFICQGVTTVEAKSGYGLSTESELTQLQIIKELDSEHPIDLVPTFLGAHEFPDEYRDRREEYVELLIEEMIPAVRSGHLAAFSDVFCEDGVFTNDQSFRLQQAAKESGLKLKFHADELKSTGGAELAASMKATSADHLVFISEQGIKALAKAGTAAVLLPGTTFSLGSKKYAPARKMIEEGVVVALSTDCNPGSNYSESLPLMMSFAMVHYGMTAAEALCAVTVNAAYAIDCAAHLGRLEPGMQADLVVWDAEDYRELAYHYGVPLCKVVVKRGKVIHPR